MIRQFLVLLLCAASVRAADDPAGRAVEIAYESKDPAVIAQAAEVIEAHLRLEPDDLARRQALAIVYLDRLQQPRTALPHLEAIRAAVPGDARWAQALARARRASGQRTEAAALFAEAAKASPGDVWAHYELGRTLGELGRHDEAIAALRAAQQIEPDNADVRSALDAQLAATEKQRAPVPTPEPARAAPPRAVDEVERRAYQSGRVEDFSRAAEALEEELRRAPGDRKKRESLAYIYLEKLRVPAQAIPHLEHVVAARPRDAAWRTMFARACAEAGRTAEAAEAYRAAAGLAPRDPWARYHLAELCLRLKLHDEARAAIDEALALDPGNAYARALLGDLHRAEWDTAAARAEYDAALAADPRCSTALAGLEALHQQQRAEAKLSLYTFDDTDGLRQTGLFASGSFFLRDGLRFGLSVSEWFFKKAPGETVERFEAGLNASYRPVRWLVLSAGAGFFKTQNATREYGGDFAAYLLPHPAFDAWVSFRPHAPINDSYVTARDSMTQDTWTVGLNLRPARDLSLSAKASYADYSDGNTRRSTLVTLAWLASARANATVKLEWEWLDYEVRTPAYSSPSDYHLLRPAIELKPRLTDWLSLDLRAELTYVTQDAEWGSGLRVGPRFHLGDGCEFGGAFLKYEIPSEVTTWSGEGWLVDFACRF